MLAGWKTAAEDGQRVDLDQNLLLSLDSMEVRRVVFAVEDTNDDAVESAKLRHALAVQRSEDTARRE